ncbi:MAG: IS1 family transposase [Desulfobacteraceae bacterium]|nr:IS1 family transposase [Desulfobacteraceae bacterium]
MNIGALHFGRMRDRESPAIGFCLLPRRFRFAIFIPSSIFYVLLLRKEFKMPDFKIACPNCGSENVEPTGPQVWTCHACGKPFQEAAVQDLSKKEK